MHFLKKSCQFKNFTLQINYNLIIFYMLKISTLILMLQLKIRFKKVLNYKCVIRNIFKYIK